MNRRSSIFIIAVIFFIFMTSCKKNSGMTTSIRQPVHAGSFYPAEQKQLNEYLEKTLANIKIETDEIPKAVIVPHAGYSYSGETAAHAYKLFQKDPSLIKRVILLAPSHYSYFVGIVFNSKEYNTPLGTYKTDLEAIAKLKDENLLHKFNEVATIREHSDEIQIPFLQKVLPNAKLVPIIVGTISDTSIEKIAQALSKIIDDQTIIIASSDFTHYGPRFDYTPEFKSKNIRTGIFDLDTGAINFITKIDSSGFLKYVDQKQETICGKNPIAILLKIFELNNWVSNAKLLKYTTSGELTGDWENSVSYATISLGKIKPDIKTNIKPIQEKHETTEPKKFLSKDEEKTLLKLSRYVLNYHVEQGVTVFPETQLKDFLNDKTKQHMGVFVTLNKNNDLRGCIGQLVGVNPLFQGVVESTISAASKDSRFSPVQAKELNEIKIEISVLSPIEKVNKIEDIVLGIDGLLFRNGTKSSVFLPQIPIEQNWDKKTFLEKLSEKAGLDKNAYKESTTTLYKFTAQVFEEE